MPKIMLDAGHGQSDPGAVGPTRLKEKDAALALTKRVGRLLEEQGVEVSYTRIDDKRLVDTSSAKDLQARADKANRAKVDYVVSIHHNSAAVPAAMGQKRMWWLRAAGLSSWPSGCRRSSPARQGSPDRGVKTANLACSGKRICRRCWWRWDSSAILERKRFCAAKIFWTRQQRPSPRLLQSRWVFLGRRRRRIGRPRLSNGSAGFTDWIRRFGWPKKISPLQWVRSLASSIRSSAERCVQKLLQLKKSSLFQTAVVYYTWK